MRITDLRPILLTHPYGVGGAHIAQCSACFVEFATERGALRLIAIENEFWDIAGKAQRVPVYELFGGAVHERLALYASAGMPASDVRALRETSANRAAAPLPQGSR